jgi:hypothetical protein
MDSIDTTTPDNTLHAELRGMIAGSRTRLAAIVNCELTRLYWSVGERLRREVLGGERATYGTRIVAQLGEKLAAEFGRGFEARNLRRMIQFSEGFPDPSIVSTLSAQLSWSHMCANVYVSVHRYTLCHMSLSPIILAAFADKGPLRAVELTKMGASPEQLRREVAKGELIRTTRGVYALPTWETEENRSLVEACLRSNRGVVCLLSALAFHKVTSQNPASVWLALPQGSRSPQWHDVSVRVIHLAPRFHSADVEIHVLPEGTVRVFSLVRSLVDAFRFRNAIGLDVALEAIREATRTKRVRWDELHRAAKARGVAGSIRPYLEAL